MRWLDEEVAEAAAAGWVSELSQGLGLYLADALTGDTELSPDLFQCAAAAIIKAEAQLEDTSLTTTQGIENAADLFFEELVGGGVGRGEGSLVFDKVAKVGVFLFADGGFEGDGLL